MTMYPSKFRRTEPIHEKAGKERSWPTLIVALASFLITLSLVIRANALPVEAHITETWYAYKHDIAYDFNANVQRGSIYASDSIRSEDLLQMRLPTEPPSYRRLLVAKLTDSVTLALPYRFKADHDADITVTYWIDGTFAVPNLWQRPYPFVPKTVVTVHGKDVNLDQLKVEIPIKQLIAELEKLTLETKINQEQAEIRVRPVFQVTVNGLREPIATELAPEIALNIRGTNFAIEVDDSRTIHDEKNYSVSRILPATVSILGYSVEVNLLRQIGTTLAVIFAALTVIVMAVQWGRKKRQGGEEIKLLGSSLITAASFEMPYNSAIAELQSMKELLQLHLQTERPIIQVGQTYYLVDATTCYRVILHDPTPK
jgi:hypothetical protein